MKTYENLKEHIKNNIDIIYQKNKSYCNDILLNEIIYFILECEEIVLDEDFILKSREDLGGVE